MNGCDENLTDAKNDDAELLLQPTDAPLCSHTMNYTCKAIKQLNLQQINRELSVHKVYLGRFKLLRPQKIKLLLKHYKEKHFKKMYFKKPKLDKAKKEYKTLTVDDFLKYFHQQHFNILSCMTEAIDHYWRYPKMLDEARLCFDYNELRKTVHSELGELFANTKKVMYELCDLKRLQNIYQFSEYQEKGGDRKLAALKKLLKKFQTGVTFDYKITEVIELATVSFRKIVEGINKDNEEEIDVNNACDDYQLLTSRIFQLSITKQLVKHWTIESSNRNRRNVYTMSNDLTNLILGVKELYDGCADAVYPYEMIACADACEPAVEQNFFMLLLMLAGKHTINLKHWFNEKILVTECKDEYSQKAENILQKSAVDWRHDHSSPIVKQSKYEISPPVDKELGICKKNVHTRLILPYNLSHEFKTSFLTKREVLALKVDDIIDFKMENGFYCNCKVLNWDAAYTVELEYCYDEIKTDSFREDNIDRYVLADKKFAFVNSITKRKNYRFKSLEKGAMLDVKIQGQWFQGIVINKDAKSGQYLFEVNDITHWFHVDDEDNVKRLMM
eukprot:355889_1